MGCTTAADWPDAQAVMIHTAHTLLETGTLAPADLLRRLLTDWAQGMGRPRLIRVTDGYRPQRTGHGFIAGLAVISILRKTDRRTAQQEAIHLAALLNASPAETEALEVASIFIRRALLSGDPAHTFEPMEWEGDDRVAAVSKGLSLPTDEPRDLVSALDQARTLVLNTDSLTIAFDALVRVGASPAAFIMTGMFAGAVRGAADLGFIANHPDRHPTTTARLEALGGQLMARAHDARASTCS
ncbi:hypothetical protein [Brevundimonas sp. A19_0]|jgi:hypothetical protein|uniref:hypothetical protein n=1 Tax=Brevundimonas sp. A19_0 TaxID=2821087 RepID=UPI001ADD4E9C|nr:hypothetical protein [Brevundimonas sp. A19_0]MBO9501507.1 hypothetical protein [Brevundimonas sp. A19_0]